MNKTELVDRVAQQLELPRVKARQVVGAVLDGLTQGLAEDQKVTLSGFGTFSAKRNPPRMGFHPAKQEPYLIPETVSVSFHPAVSLKEALDKKCD